MKIPFIGSRVVPRGLTGGQADFVKLIVAFHNFANAPKKVTCWGYGYVGARTDTTQQSGQTPDKEGE